MAGKKGRSGAPKGNRNALRHGLKAGKLPKDSKYIEVRLNSFRRRIEDIVLAAKGEITLADAASIQTALRWERHASLCQRWLTKEGENITLPDRIKYSREIATASDKRDEALYMLELETDELTNAWSVIDEPQQGESDDEEE